MFLLLLCVITAVTCLRVCVCIYVTSSSAWVSPHLYIRHLTSLFPFPSTQQPKRIMLDVGRVAVVLKVHRKVIFNVSFKTTVVVLVLWAVLIICKFMGQPSWLWWVFFIILSEKYG